MVTPTPDDDLRWRDTLTTIREVIDLLDQTRHTFRSKQIQRARHLLEEVLRKAEEAQTQRT